MDGFTDISQVLKLAIYALLHRGEVVYIGKARVPLVLLSAHRDLARQPAAAWLPIKGINFDQVLIRTAHPDRVDAELATLISKHNPRHNRAALAQPASAPIPFRRRI